MAQPDPKPMYRGIINRPPITISEIKGDFHTQDRTGEIDNPMYPIITIMPIHIRTPQGITLQEAVLGGQV